MPTALSKKDFKKSFKITLPLSIPTANQRNPTDPAAHRTNKKAKNRTSLTVNFLYLPALVMVSTQVWHSGRSNPTVRDE